MIALIKAWAGKYRYGDMQWDLTLHDNEVDLDSSDAHYSEVVPVTVVKGHLDLGGTGGVLGPIIKLFFEGQNHLFFRALVSGDEIAFNDARKALTESKLRLEETVQALHDHYADSTQGILDNNIQLADEKKALSMKIDVLDLKIAEMETSYEQHYMDKREAEKSALVNAINDDDLAERFRTCVYYSNDRHDGGSCDLCDERDTVIAAYRDMLIAVIKGDEPEPHAHCEDPDCEPCRRAEQPGLDEVGA